MGWRIRACPGNKTEPGRYWSTTSSSALHFLFDQHQALVTSALQVLLGLTFDQPSIYFLLQGLIV